MPYCFITGRTACVTTGWTSSFCKAAAPPVCEVMYAASETAKTARVVERIASPLRSTPPRTRSRRCDGGASREKVLDVGKARARGTAFDISGRRRGRGTELTKQIDEVGIGRRAVRERPIKNEAEQSVPIRDGNRNDRRSRSRGQGGLGDSEVREKERTFA